MEYEVKREFLEQFSVEELMAKIIKSHLNDYPSVLKEDREGDKNGNE